MLPRLTMLIALGALMTACATTDSSDTSDPSEPAATRASTPASPPASPPSTAPTGPARVGIVAAGIPLTATLRDTDAARDLVAQLPLTLSMSDHGGVEKTGRLLEPLSTDGEPDGADPDPGDLGYYAPGNDLVLYHGDQSFFPGIVILGTLEGDLDALARTTGEVEVEVRLAD